MDRFARTSDLIQKLNLMEAGVLTDYDFIRIACEYFDSVKDDEIKEHDSMFLRYIANKTGIPHYYNVLKQFTTIPDETTINLNSLASMLYEVHLHTSPNSMLHKYQKLIVDKFTLRKRNRYFLSASTSFGKTHLVFEVLRKMKYKNILLVFPTIALLSENHDRIITNPNYSDLKAVYAIHTLSDSSDLSERNIFLLTPERYLTFAEYQPPEFSFDFAFIDEIQKIDADHIIDPQVKENERDSAYRLSSHIILSNAASDLLLAGPYIKIDHHENSFSTFLNHFHIEAIDFNNYEIVNKRLFEIKGTSPLELDEHLHVRFSTAQKTQRLIELVQALTKMKENMIIYCAGRGKDYGAEYYAEKLSQANLMIDHDNSPYLPFISHIESKFSPDWIVVKALKTGVGLHHGLIPKYIQKEIITLFNSGSLPILISTTTITEGVNTSAKNIIVTLAKKGSKKLEPFDAKNIAGRAGRFGFHFTGRVIVLHNNFKDILESANQTIQHKNYDVSSQKDDVDIFFTDSGYLNVQDLKKRDDILAEQTRRSLPEYVFEYYKTVSRSDKIVVYDEIVAFTEEQFEQVYELIRRFNSQRQIDLDAFQLIIQTVTPIVKSQKLLFLIQRPDKNARYSILTHLVSYYLREGIHGSIQYKTSQGLTIDRAIMESSEFAYSMLKYHVCKYLGVFNLMYRYVISINTSVPFADITGIDSLLLKLEYNAITEKGRIASDYGAPSSVIEYYENMAESDRIRNDFDNFEKAAFSKIEALLDNL